MMDEALVEKLNRGYVCPLDAGPAWREACEYGIDMSLVEDALSRTPEERLEQHQRVLNVPYKSVHGEFLILGLEALVTAKNATGRDRDLMTIKLLRAIKEKTEGRKT